MSRREDEKLVRKHVMIFEDDWQWAETHFARTVGISKAFRTIIRSYRKQIESKALASAKRPSVGDDIDAELEAGKNSVPG